MNKKLQSNDFSRGLRAFLFFPHFPYRSSRVKYIFAEASRILQGYCIRYREEICGQSANLFRRAKFTYEDEEPRTTRFAAKSARESWRAKKAGRSRRKELQSPVTFFHWFIYHLTKNAIDREQPWALRHGGLLPSTFVLSLSLSLRI